jgi:hypothetical protein
MVKDADHLIEKLDSFIRKYYKDRLIRGVLYSIGLLVLAFVVMAVLEHLGHFSSRIRTILFWTYLVGAGIVLYKYILTPAFKWLRLGKTISHEQAARVIGKHFSQVQDKLLNTLQLRERAHENPAQRDWIEASIAQRSQELGNVPFVQAIDLRKNRKYLRYALPPLMILLVLLFAAPNIITDSTERLVSHGTEFVPDAPFQFIVQHDTLEVPEQEDFLLALEISGKLVPEQVLLVMSGRTVPMVKQDNVNYQHRFRNVQQDTEFWFTADGFRSKTFVLKTIPNPTLLNFSMKLDYPAYLNVPDKTIDNTGDATVPAGTIVTWQAATKSADALLISFQDTVLNLKPAANDRFELSKQFMKAIGYTITPQNRHMTSPHVLQYRIDVVPDLFPTINASQEIDSMRPKLMYFEGAIEDDHGFKRLEFHYRFSAGGDTLADKDRTGVVPINFDRASNAQRFYHTWNISALPVGPGDQLEYWFQVWDNDGINGSKSARTRILEYNAPSRKELADQQDQQSDAIKASMEQGIKEANDLQKELDQLRRELIEKKETDWQDKQKLEDILDKQKKLEKRIDQMNQSLQNSNEKMRENRQLDEQLLQKQEQLEELFENVLSEEMKKLYEEIQEMMEKLDKDKLQEQLQEMEMDQKDIEKELDRSLELFKQLEVEQKALDIAEQLEELAEEQENLAEETKEEKTDQEELKEKQEGLNKKFEELKEELEELSEKNEELENPLDIPDLDEQEKAVEEEMQESSDQLEKSKNQKASESQQKASGQMKQMAAAMQNSMEAQSQQQQEEDMEALRQLLENIVQLSFDQEGVMNDMGELDRKDPRFGNIGQDQRSLRDDARMIEDSLFALSKRVPQLESIVNREMSLVNSNMDQAIDEISEARVNIRRKANASEKQQRAMTSLNNLALLLDEALQQMMQQASQSQPGSGSCDKPGGSGQGKPKPNSKKMQAMQKQLQKQLEKMRDAMKKGQKPGEGKDGQSGMPGMSQSLAQMAAQQAAIRKELQKMAQELNKDGSGAGNGLNELAKEMEEQEKDIVNKKIAQQTLERQKDIMTRLLEHEKAEREREFDNKRKSSEGRQNLGEDPVRYFEYKRKKEREAELLRTVPPALKPYYKDRVNKYFGTFEQP